MDINTWSSLTNTERDEIKQIGSDFIRMVLNSNAADGRDFYMKYEIRFIGDYYCIYEKSISKRFGDFKSSSKKIIAALMADAVQNYGR